MLIMITLLCIKTSLCIPVTFDIDNYKDDTLSNV